MRKIYKSFSEEDYIDFIKGLLSCPAIWTSEAIELKINADIHKVQWEIFKWLSIPERLWNILSYHIATEKGEKE